MQITIERQNAKGEVIEREGPFPPNSEAAKRAEMRQHHIAELHNRSRKPSVLFTDPSHQLVYRVPHDPR
jgi:hypothetical protein